MACRKGYEYRYHVSRNPDESDEVHVSTNDETEEDHGSTYFLEVRTNFVLKTIHGAEVNLGNEVFGARLTLDDYGSIVSDKDLIDIHVRDRLSQYRMPDKYIRGFAQSTLDFVQILSCDPRYRSMRTKVKVVLDVCTVQLEGELIGVTLKRSVKPESMIPLEIRGSDLEEYLVRLPILIVRDEEGDDDEDSCPICLRRSCCFSDEKRGFHHKEHSVGREEASTLVEGYCCPICFRQPVVGDQIAFLSCEQGHAFHYHCVARWLMSHESCPVCRVDIDIVI